MSPPSEEGKDNTTKDATNQKGDNQYNHTKSNVQYMTSSCGRMLQEGVEHTQMWKDEAKE